MPEHAPGTYKGGEGTDSPEKPSTPELKDESQQLVKALGDLDIKVQIKGVIFGSRITRYRVLLVNLQDRQKLEKSVKSLGLAMNLRATPAVSNGDEARVLFVDLPRTKETWETVRFEKLITWAANNSVKEINKLMVFAGVTVTGQDVSFDLAKTPHLLVAGTTNSGKSVCLHSLILSLLMIHSSDSLQLALIDPKQVEFAAYGKIPHLYSGLIATEANQSRDMLESLVALMEERYTKFKELNVVNIAEAREKEQILVVFLVPFP
jgi:S-DNA-T family DNA segregation ATPase FtsK/SpoIIIE